MDKYLDMIEDKSRFVIKNYRINEDEIDQLFQISQLVILPYTDATQSGVIPIAFSYETLVIASRTGAIPEVIHNFKNGLLVNPKDKFDLYNKIEYCIKNEKHVSSMVSNAKTFSENDMSWKKIAKNTFDVYKKMS